MSVSSPLRSPGVPRRQRQREAGGLGRRRSWPSWQEALAWWDSGVGTVFWTDDHVEEERCPKACPDLCPDSNGVGLWSDAKSAGNVSTVAFIVGGVALAGGAALWFTAKPESSSGPSAQVGVGLGSLQLKGVW